ncbi:hypothetical protein GB931_00540 [Modestobacter sp. I12A-02628]|uniref:Uncharacterized protein n=1 Tax=Goekera deserti TaxID=2497753 RepID=A0A7K3WKM4_9ACTN|nr:hypothetical protein [Goekera deserti]MPQ96434.1 hypothetical protein [Goekera deserti]NDI47253.1 hypothetical protein [Goekera deserti]NEL56083.1 hypothetical protein [Goekera deserti]
MWTTHHPGSDDDHDAFLRRMQAPENEVPVVVPLTLVMARRDDVAVVLTPWLVYSTGVRVTLVVRTRESGTDLNDLFWHSAGTSSADGFRLGVEFADGRWTASTGGPPGGEVVLNTAGGSGGDRSVEQDWWLYPVPPPGPLTVAIRCGAAGIDETVVTVDATPLATAAAAVEELWPWTPPTPPDQRAPEPPTLPADSWFAR